MSDLGQRRRKLPWHVDTRHADLSDARQIRKPQADGCTEENRLATQAGRKGRDLGAAEARTAMPEGCQTGRVLVGYW